MKCKLLILLLTILSLISLKGGTMPDFILKSKDFKFDETVHERFTCDGEDISPELEWTGAPEGTKSFAIIVDDPDAPRDEPFVHWVVYNIPGNQDRLEQGVPQEEILTSGITQGYNDFNEVGYRGPCPPKDHGVHHYHFVIYALDKKLDKGPGATKQDILNQINGHVIKSAELIGLYERTS